MATTEDTSPPDQPAGDEAGGAEKVASFAKKPLIALSLVNFVDQVDVGILRGVLPVLQDEWGLSDFKVGMLGFAFIFVNTLAAIPAGWVADHYKRTRVIGWTLLSWSVLSSFCATAVNFWHLFAARAMLGFGQSIDDPASTSLLGDYYPARMRGRIFSVQTVANFLGSAGIALGGLVATTLGWRWAFVIVGAPGSLVGFWIFRLREPKRGEADLIERFGVEAAVVTEAATAAHVHSEEKERPMQFLRRAWGQLWREMKMIFGIRTMRYVLVGVSTLLFTVSGVGYWLPFYHERYSNMTEGQAVATTAGILAFAGITGTLWGGSVADKLFSRGPQGRINLVAGGIMVCTGLFIVSWSTPWVPVRLVLQFFGVIAITSAFPALRASMMDVVPAEQRGVGASAFALTSALFGTALAPPLVGILSDATSLLGAFYMVTPPIFIGTFILLRARSTIEEDAAAIINAMVAAHEEPGEPTATTT